MPRRAMTGLLLTTQVLSLTLGLLPAGAAPVAAPPKPITQTLAAQRAEIVSDVRYDLHLDLTGAGETFGGKVTMRFSACPVRGDLVVDFADGTVGKLTVNGRAVPIRHAGGQLLLAGKDLRTDNTVTVAFTGRYGTNGFGLVRFVDPVDRKVYCYTDLEPDGAHHVFPCFDQPDLKARTTLQATTPAGWTVVSNQAIAHADKAGTRQTVRFAQTLPISPYLNALHAGHYVGWHDKAGAIPLGIYTRASLAPHMDAEAVFAITKQGLDYYGRYFHCPYPFGKYDQVFVPEYQHGAMENPGDVTFNERYIYLSKPTDNQRFSRDNVILHEMAHMWFGDLVTMRWWNDLWLNESFATYMAAQAKEALPRYGDTWQRFYGQKQWAYETDGRRTTHPIQGPVPDTDTATGSFDGITYGKGASVMKQLSYYIGPEAFRDGLRTYFQRHAFHNATLTDFLAALQQHTKQDLTAWGKQWLATAGLNAVLPRWSCSDGVIRDFTLVQRVRNGDPLLRPHRTEIGLLAPDAAGKLVVRTRQPVAYTGETTAVASLNGQPCPALVFANYGDQDYAKVLFDPVSLATAQQSLSDIADPFLRLQVWDGLWQLVLDRQLDPLSYWETLQRHLPQETVASTVESLLGDVGIIVWEYWDEPARRELLPEIERFVWAQLALQAPGSDQQQYWANTAIGLSRTPEGQARLLDWLQHPDRISGLELSQDRRWQIIAILTVSGHPQAKALADAEKVRDPSDRGERSLEALRAATPDAGAKATAWTRITTDKTSSISVLTAVMGGFEQPVHRTLTRPYADRYFDTVAEIYRTRPYAFAKRFAEAMFPHYQTEPAVIAKANAMIAQQGLPAELRKILQDQTEALERRAALQTLARAALSRRQARSTP